MKDTMKVTSFTTPGVSRWNEDALVMNEDLRLYGVIDGATSLVSYSGPNGETGGYFAASIIAEYLNGLRIEQIGSGTEGFVEALLKANQQLRSKMASSGIDVERKEQLWSACAALIRIDEKSVHFAQAGDCMLTAVYDDGTIRVVTRDQLAIIDGETRRLWAEGMARGCASRQQLWDYVYPQIVQGRQSANTPNGYGTFNGEEALAEYIEYGRINRIHLKSLLLISDGMYVPKPPEARPFDAGEVAELVMEKGIEGYVKWLVDLEESDPDCLRLPRVKKSDDKTAILIEF